MILKTVHEKLRTSQDYGSMGLYHVFARQMDPELGRFVSLDPQLGSLSSPQSMNRYVYCVNNPLRFTDPTGEFSLSKWWDKNWKTVAIVALCVAAVAITVVTLGTAAPLSAMAYAMAVGAISGASVNEAVYLSSTPSSQWTLSGAMGAAASGAMSGAAIGAAMVPGVGWGAAFAIGAVGGAAGYASGNAIAGKEITAQGLLLSGLIGGLGGATGKWISSSLRNYYSLQELYRLAGRDFHFAPLIPSLQNLDYVALDASTAGWGREVGGAMVWAGYSALYNVAKRFALND